MTSKTLFLTLAIFLVFSSAQDCNNPLLAIYGIPGEATPQPSGNLTFCPTLQPDTCCSNETLNTLQAELTNTTNSLNEIAAQRDNFLVDVYYNYTAEYVSLANQLDGFDADLDDIQDNFPVIGYTLEQQVNLYKTILSSLNNYFLNEELFAENLVNLQQTRTECWTTLLQVQSSTWCLACDPNYAAEGVEPDGTINAGPEVCASIQVACVPYLYSNLPFNALIQAYQTLDRLNNTVTWLNAYRANGNQIPEGIVIDAPITQPVNATQSTVTAPPGCRDITCPWMCENLFTQSYELNETLAANGAGDIGGADIVSLTVIRFVVVTVEETELTETVSEEILAEEVLAEETILEEAIIEVTAEINEETVLIAEETITASEETIAEVAENVVEEIVEAAEEAATGGNRLLDENPWNFRFLQDGTWNPALNETGFEAPVETDPGNVSNAEEGGTPEVTPPTTQDSPIVKATISVALVVLAVGMA